jgi:hypothetical protein
MNMAASINLNSNMSNAAVAERRGRDESLPANLHRILNDDQRIALNLKEQFGWFVAFVRRPLFQPVEVVLSNPDGSDFMTLEEDGALRPFYNVRTRDFN